MHVRARYGFRWREIETAFESILTGAVINSNYIELRRFQEDASEIVLECVQYIMQRYDSIKINTIFNGIFVAQTCEQEHRYSELRTISMHQFTRMICNVRRRVYPSITRRILRT